MSDDGLLNVDMKGNPKGADVLVPEISFSFVWDRARFKQDYQREISKYIAKVNSLDFQGWKAGEVLFVGCTGDLTITETSGRTEYEGSLTMEFSVRRNRASFTVGNIENIDAEGWQYVHPRYAPAPRGAELVAIIVSDVYEKVDFSKLQSGADVILPVGSAKQPRIVPGDGVALPIPVVPSSEFMDATSYE
jgi:hypothetical protein